MIRAMVEGRAANQAAAAWESLHAGQWDQAKVAFEGSLADSETAAALDGLARSRWWLADVPGAIDAWERAFAAYRREDDDGIGPDHYPDTRRRLALPRDDQLH